jgi:hypothetical protein
LVGDNALSAAGPLGGCGPAHLLHMRDSLFMGSTLYVVGGRQREPRGVSAGVQDWYRFDRAMILAVDADSGDVRVVAEHETPPGACAPVDPAILFKSASLRGNRLYVCTQTEILVYQVPDFTVLEYLSLPFFNDIHHVLPTESGRLLVAISGLDMVVELDMEGTVYSEWSATDTDTWDRFSRDVDYRLVASTKPHHAHPNHVFMLDQQPWATRFEQRDAICLDDRSRRIDIAVERPHDGELADGRLYFTTVNGHIVIADPVELSVESARQLLPRRRDELLGWCRGIHVVGDTAWIGFSRIRPTKIRENVGWVLRGFRKDLGTRISLYDLTTMECVRDINLEDAGLGAVFSIHPA